MKALEKAAADRAQDIDSASTPSQQTGAGAPRELSLEAVEPKSISKPDEKSPGAEASANRVASAPSGMPRSPLTTPAAPATSASPFGAKSPTRTAAGAASADAQARAATVVNAGVAQPDAASGTHWVAWLIARPVYVLGGLAGLFLLLYGGYVYLQIMHPQLLIKSAPRAQPVAATPAPVPASTQPLSNGAPQPADAAQSSFVTMQSVLGNRTNAAPPASPPVADPDAPPATSSARANSGSVSAQAPRAAPTQSGATASVAPSPAARVAISRGDTAVPRVNPAVSEAWAALDARQFDTAQRLYNQVLRSEPSNVDALLGLAAIAQHESRPEDVQRHFMAILDVEPRHTLAQSGLVALMSRADPQAAETRLKQLLAREPSSALYFNLGNLYAEQTQWPQAQQAYFQAHTLDPRNPDYAYNLAVGLEHLGQSKLALDFYRKALQLAAYKGSANFDAARIQTRINQLAARAN